MAQTIASGIKQKAALQQFIKFCIIGASSTIIDTGILKLLVDRNWNPNVAQLVSFCIAVVNGYVWNSVWTFRGMGAGRRHEQFVKFVAVNVVGLGLTLVIINTLFFIMSGHILHKGDPDKLHLAISKGVSIVIVAFWNFVGNKRWTFRGTATA